jgi:hypothetical protein
MAYDKSLANKTNYLMIFDKAPEVQYFCQEVPVPAISLEGEELSNGRISYAEVGGTLQFDQLTITFLVDENLQNYKEIYDWFMALRHPMAGNIAENVTTSRDLSDATVTVLDNNKNAQVRFTFVDCWPSNLDGLIYDVRSEGDEPQIASITLNYSYFTMELV